jgi:hypothetical protein
LKALARTWQKKFMESCTNELCFNKIAGQK